jgi:hypothetical protein
MTKQVADGRDVQLPAATVEAAEQATTTRPLFDALKGLAKQYGVFIHDLRTFIFHIRDNAQTIGDLAKRQKPTFQSEAISVKTLLLQEAFGHVMTIQGFIYSCCRGTQLSLLSEPRPKAYADLCDMIGSLTNALYVVSEDIECVKKAATKKNVLISPTTPIEKWYSVKLLKVYKRAIKILRKKNPRHNLVASIWPEGVICPPKKCALCEECQKKEKEQAQEALRVKMAKRSKRINSGSAPQEQPKEVGGSGAEENE